MGIVGHKIHTYLTAVGTFQPRAYTITEHIEVRELHATKGFRLIQHRRKDQRVTMLPHITEWRACNTTTFIPKNARQPRLTEHGSPVLKGIRP